MPVECPSCASDDLRLVRDLEDGRKVIACEACGEEWTRGVPRQREQPVRRTAARRRTP